MTNDTPDIAALRKRFEEWLMNIARQWGVEFTTERNNGNCYVVRFVQLAWEAFHAGARTEPVPESVLFMLDCHRTGSSISASDYREFFLWAIKNITQLKGANDELQGID